MDRNWIFWRYLFYESLWKQDNVDGCQESFFAGCLLFPSSAGLQAAGTDHGGATLHSMYLQPSLHCRVRQGSQTLPTAAGLASALGGKRHCQNVPGSWDEVIQTEIITFCKCALVPKDPCEVGTTKFFLSEIFSGVSTQAQEGPAGNLVWTVGWPLPLLPAPMFGSESIPSSVSSSCLTAASC